MSTPKNRWLLPVEGAKPPSLPLFPFIDQQEIELVGEEEVCNHYRILFWHHFNEHKQPSNYHEQKKKKVYPLKYVYLYLFQTPTNLLLLPFLSSQVVLRSVSLHYIYSRIKLIFEIRRVLCSCFLLNAFYNNHNLPFEMLHWHGRTWKAG